MSDNGDYVEKTTTEGPTMTRREQTRVVRTPSATGWIIAAIVLVAAVVGVFLYMNQNSQSELQAARDQGAAQAQIDNATANAQTAAGQAEQSAQSSMSSAARANENAANAAAARSPSAADAGRDAAATTPAPPQP